MIRSLLLTMFAVAAIITAAVWPSDPEVPPASPPSATAGPGAIMVCPPPSVQEGPGSLPPGLHERLVDTRDTIVGDRADLAEVGVHISATRLDPVIRRVRVVVPRELPIAAGYLAEVTDPDLVCLEVGGVLE